jgi:hypothetical protein
VDAHRTRGVLRARPRRDVAQRIAYVAERVGLPQARDVSVLWREARAKTLHIRRMLARFTSRSQSLLRLLSLGACASAGLASLGGTGCGDDHCLAQCVEQLSIHGAFDVPATTGSLIIEICVRDICEEVPLDPEPVGGSVASGAGAGQPAPEMHYFICRGSGGTSCHLEDGRLRIWSDLAVGSHTITAGDVVELRIRPVRSEEPVLAASLPVAVVGVTEVCGTTCDAVGLTWD